MQVSLVEGRASQGCRAETERAEVVRLIVIDAVIGAEIGDDTHAQGGRPVGDDARRLLIPALAADDEHRALRSPDRLFNRRDLCGGGHHLGNGARRDGRGGGGDKLRVLRQADDDRAGPAGGGGVHGVGDDRGGLIGVVEDEGLLHGRAEPAGQVELLEGLAPAVAGGDKAGEDDERGGVLVGGVGGDHDIGSTRPAGDHRDARPAGHAALGHRHEARTGLLAAGDRADRRIVQAVEHIQVGLAGHAVDALDALGFELGDDEVPSRAGGRGIGAGGGVLCGGGRGRVSRGGVSSGDDARHSHTQSQNPARVQGRSVRRAASPPSSGWRIRVVLGSGRNCFTCGRG